MANDLQRCKSPYIRKRGTWVEITRSVYADVIPGQKGEVISILTKKERGVRRARIPLGYGVRIKGKFVDAFHKRVEQTRVIFFEPNEVKKCQKPSA